MCAKSKEAPIFFISEDILLSGIHVEHKKFMTESTESIAFQCIKATSV